MPQTPTLMKIGGELLEDRPTVATTSTAIANLASTGPLVVVHGGGRDIDAECARRQLPKRAVDGLRVTDEAVLEAVVSALAGTVNTRLVACLVGKGINAVGLTGVDAGLALADRASAYTSTDGRTVNLGLVGTPSPTSSPRLVIDLLAGQYVPVIATLGISRDGVLLNINADVLAAHLAVQLGAGRLLIVGGTAGVLDDEGRTIPTLDATHADEMKRHGVVSAGMVAKLDAAFKAFESGVPDVRIVSGREGDLARGPIGTRLISTTVAPKELPS